jgi:hypothetical protein
MELNRLKMNNYSECYSLLVDIRKTLTEISARQLKMQEDNADRLKVETEINEKRFRLSRLLQEKDMGKAEVQVEQPAPAGLKAYSYPCLQVLARYPDFQADYEMLENGFKAFKEKGNYLEWQKSKQFLAEYFAGIKRKDDINNHWAAIENLFTIGGKKVKDLAHAASSNGNVFKGQSKDYSEWLDFKKKYNTHTL